MSLVAVSKTTIEEEIWENQCVCSNRKGSPSGLRSSSTTTAGTGISEENKNSSNTPATATNANVNSKKIWVPTNQRPAFSDRLGEFSFKHPLRETHVPDGWKCVVGDDGEQEQEQEEQEQEQEQIKSKFQIDCGQCKLTKGQCDQNGWFYDTNFSNLENDFARGANKAEDKPKFLVRRRRWYRTLMKIETSNEENETNSNNSNQNANSTTKPICQGWLGIKSMTKNRIGRAVWKSRYFMLWEPKFFQKEKQVIDMEPIFMYFKNSNPSNRVFDRKDLEAQIKQGQSGSNKSIKNQSIRWFKLERDCLVDDTIATAKEPGYFAIHFSKKEIQIVNAHTEKARLEWVDRIRVAIATANPDKTPRAVVRKTVIRKNKLLPSTRSFSTATLPLVETSKRNGSFSKSQPNLTSPTTNTATKTKTKTTSGTAATTTTSSSATNSTKNGGSKSPSSGLFATRSFTASPRVFFNKGGPLESSFHRKFKSSFRHSRSGSASGPLRSWGSSSSSNLRRNNSMQEPVAPQIVSAFNLADSNLARPSSSGGNGSRRRAATGIERSEMKTEWISSSEDEDGSSDADDEESCDLSFDESFFGNNGNYSSASSTTTSGKNSSDKKRKKNKGSKKQRTASLRRLSIVVPPPSYIETSFVDLLSKEIRIQKTEHGLGFSVQKSGKYRVKIKMVCKDERSPVILGSPAPEDFLAVEDILLKLNDVPIESPKDAVAVLKSVPVGEEVLVRFARDRGCQLDAETIKENENKLATINRLFDKEVPNVFQLEQTVTYRMIQAHCCNLLEVPLTISNSIEWTIWFRDQLDDYFEKNADRFRILGLNMRHMCPSVQMLNSYQTRLRDPVGGHLAADETITAVYHY